MKEKISNFDRPTKQTETDTLSTNVTLQNVTCIIDNYIKNNTIKING